MIGSVVSNYKIISQIGEGGMGTVFLAEHIHLSNRKVAIKALHKQMLTNANIRQRFRNEAATLSQIDHENIVKIFDYIESDEGYFLIMEYVEGMTLEDYINNVSGPLNEERATYVMSKMLSGFGFAHQRGIIHRDVKPSNIIVSKDLSVVKILDFGVAKLLTENSNMTKHGTQMGTVYYMSPEQVKGLPVDQRSDIYSLGVSLYQMVTGTNPYQSLTTEYDVFNCIVNQQLPDARLAYPGVIPKIISIIEHATRKPVENRYSSCEEMNKALVGDGDVSSPPLLNNTLEPVEENVLEDTDHDKGKSKTGLFVFLGVIIFALLAVLINMKDIKAYYKWKGAVEKVCYIPSLRVRTDTITTTDYNIIPVTVNYGDRVSVIEESQLFPWLETKYAGYDGYINSDYLMNLEDFHILESVLNNTDKIEQISLSRYRRSLVDFIKSRQALTNVDTLANNTTTDSSATSTFEIYPIYNQQYVRTGVNKYYKRDYAVFLMLTNVSQEFVVFVYEDGRQIASNSYSDLEHLTTEQFNSFLSPYGLYYN